MHKDGFGEMRRKVLNDEALADVLGPPMPFSSLSSYFFKGK
jgi:hypothetical protein